VEFRVLRRRQTPIEFGLFVDRQCNPSRNTGIIEWEGTAERVAMHTSYILLFNSRLIEIRRIETGRLVHTGHPREWYPLCLGWQNAWRRCGCLSARKQYNSTGTPGACGDEYAWISRSDKGTPASRYYTTGVWAVPNHTFVFTWRAVFSLSILFPSFVFPATFTTRTIFCHQSWWFYAKSYCVLIMCTWCSLLKVRKHY